MELDSLHANFSFVNDDLIDKEVVKRKLPLDTDDGIFRKLWSNWSHRNQISCFIIFKVKLDRYEATCHIFCFTGFLVNHNRLLFTAGFQAEEMSVTVSHFTDFVVNAYFLTAFYSADCWCRWCNALARHFCQAKLSQDGNRCQSNFQN